MYKKFIVKLPQERLLLIDAFCRQKGLFRSTFFYQIVDKRFKENADKIKVVIENLNNKLTKDFTSLGLR